MAARIPFDFTLIDRRHQAFVEGRRDTFLTFFQAIGLHGWVLVSCALVAGLLFYWGSGSLIYDFSVKWLSAEAVITDAVPVSKGDHFDWWYLYSFKTADGGNAGGMIVESKRDKFAIGERVPVVYVQTDPKDNRYANDPLPRSVRDWFFIGLSLFLLRGAALTLRETFAGYRGLLRLARRGRPVPGYVVKAEFARSTTNQDLPVVIHFTFNTCTGAILDAIERLSFVHLAHKDIPEPGTTVAVWYATQEGCVLI
jgi:hypothetical protein